MFFHSQRAKRKIKKSEEKFKIFAKQTLGVGLTYLFLALWILSIWGTPKNHTLFDLFFYSVAFGGTAILSIYIGLKNNITMLQHFGIVFFFINLITKYFEHFWDTQYKSIFFAILGLVFLLIAIKAEKLGPHS
ncbi:MAG: hypothetical protein LBQ03_01305 [Puniceicoccales bacterium]|nr:hypothetical protein [Puniceicoccales bacterium]